MSKSLWTLSILLGGLALGFCQLLSGADMETSSIGKKIAPFTLTDPQNHRKVLSSDFKEKKAIAVLFLGTECPLNNAYLPTLAALHKEYSGRGVQFLGVNANQHDKPSEVAEHARKHGIPFPVLKDVGNVVADQFGARRTPEAFLLDAAGTIRYQGRIDDQHGIGFQRPKPTRRDLAEAIDEVLAGKAVSQPQTIAPGCIIGRVASPSETGTVTYTKHVARIIQKKCQECHRPGQIGPMALMTYDDVAAWSETVGEVIEERRMPPWHADPRYGEFSNDLRLTPEERAHVLAWVRQGCPKGDDKDLPAPRVFPTEWRIGKPDVILTMPDAFAVPAQAPRHGIPYKHFFIDPNFKEDRWITHAEARPGAAAVVHHIVVFILPPGKQFNKDDPTNQVLCGTAPGDMPLLLPPGMAKKVPAGSKLVMQLHYTPNGTAYQDRSSIALIFAGAGPVKEVRTVPIFNFAFRIPPGESNYRVESNFQFEKDALILNFMPHMHLRGKDFLYEAIYPDGKKEIVLSVPRFQFHWQSVYRLTKPLALPRGSRMHCVAHFDNSSRNPNNPNPAATVYWGDQTWQEMMIGWLDYAYDRFDR